MKNHLYYLFFLPLLPTCDLSAQLIKPVKDSLTIDTNTKTLHEVKVVGQKKSFEAKNGKMIFNTGQQLTLASSSALEVLQRTPGVSLDQNEAILLKGSAAVNVMIDGKMTYLSAQQLTNMLKGMTAANISKIEIISTPGAQFDAAGNAGVINIITKKSTAKGYAADISSTVGGGHYFLNRHNFTGNIRNKWMNVYGTFDYNRQHSLSKRNATQKSVQIGNNIIYNRHILDEMKTNYYTYRLGVDITLNKKNEISLLYNGYTDGWKRNAPGTTLVSVNGTEKSIIENQTTLKEPYYNNGFNFSHLLKIDTTGKQLQTNVDYISYKNNSDGTLTNVLKDIPSGSSDPLQQLKFHQPSHIDIRSFKTDLEIPYKSIIVKSGLKYAMVTINNDFRYDSLINNSFVYAPTLSDHFIYKENIAAGYLSFQKRWKNTTIDAGLRVEHTHSDANSINNGIQNIRNYTDIFPSLAIDQSLGLSSKLSFSLSRRINRPVYTNLNPVRYYSDKFAYFQGNPNLLPEKGWTASLLYVLKDNYSATLSYSRANNFIGQTVRSDDENTVLVTSNGNFSHKDRFDLLLYSSFKVAKYWHMSNNVNLSYTRYPLQQLVGTKIVSKASVDLSSIQTISLPAKTTLEMSANYTSPTLNGFYVNRYYFTLDGGLKKSLYNSKFDIRLTATDILRTVRLQGYSISDFADNVYHTKPDTRRFYLSLTYHLGGKVKQNRSQKLEEKDRL
jgi:hypothetical protein